MSERSPYLKCLIYGLPGVGKTVFAAQFPRPLILDAENGTRSLLNHPEFGLQDVLILPIQSFADIEKVFWELKDESSELSKKVDTVVIDSISELQKRQLDEMLVQAKKQDSRRDVNLPYQQDYLINTNALRRMAFGFRDLEKNLVITAHSIEDKDESQGIILTRPDTTPKLARTLEGIMDLMGFLSVEYRDGKSVRTLQVHPERRVKAKSRVGGLQPTIYNPHPDMLFNANKNNEPNKETETA